MSGSGRRWTEWAMGGEWEYVSLGEVSVNHDAVRVPVKESERKPGPFPYYGASGVVDHVDSYLFDGEYLLVAEDGENLRTRQTPLAFIARGRFWVNNHAHILQGSSRALTRFLHYALAAGDIAPYLTGAVMPKLTQANLNRIPILLPPMREQERIVDLLAALDDKIELNRRITETLEATTLALFKSWFVDFDPVRAKAEGRPTGLPDETAALFPHQLGEDGLPVGWQMTPISELFEVVGGNTPRTDTDSYWGGPHEWATPKDLSNLDTPILLRTERTLSDAGLSQSNSGLVPRGSLLLSTRAPIGYMAFADQPTAINQGLAGLAPKELSAAYAWGWCIANLDNIKANAGGSTFPEISKSTLRNLAMLAPSQRVAKAF